MKLLIESILLGRLVDKKPSNFYVGRLEESCAITSKSFRLFAFVPMVLGGRGRKFTLAIQKPSFIPYNIRTVRM